MIVIVHGFKWRLYHKTYDDPDMWLGITIFNNNNVPATTYQGTTSICCESREAAMKHARYLTEKHIKERK